MLFIDTFWRAPFLALAWVISATGMLETLAGADNTALKIMEDETVVFSSDLDEGKAKLLFPPKKIIKVQRADGSQEYEEGKDFILEQGRVLQLTPGSQIPLMPYFTNAALKGVYNVSDTSQKFIFSPGSSLKHKKYDIRVTYSHAEGDLDRLYAGSTESKLSKTIAKLKQGQIKALTFFGDSITVGAQASGFYKDTAGDKIVNLPYAPLVFERVKKKFPASATLVYSNLAVGGKTSAWGVQNIAEVVGTNPDIAVIAFGMNDGSGKVAVEEYQDNTRKMIEAIRAANAETAIILIAEFSPNPDLALAHYDQRANNRNALRELFQSLDNAAFVDVGHVSRQIVAAKKFQDISGNNINHPNDFLHRIYADLVMKTFEEPR